MSKSWSRHNTLFESIALVYLASASNLAFSVLANLIIPITASKLDYANFRMIILYANYAGIFHFGLLSGLYLVVVGKKLHSIEWTLLRKTKNTLILLQVLTIPVVMLTLIYILPANVNRLVIVTSAIGWILANFITFYAYLLQGTGNFRSYTAVTLIFRLTGITLLIFLVFTNRTNTQNMIVAFLIPLTITTIIYEVYWWKLKRARKIDSVNSLNKTSRKMMWRRGLTLYFANIGIVTIFLLASVWVSLFFEPLQFADFAFAYGFASVTYIAIDGLAVAIAPYLARNPGSGTGSDSSQYANLIFIWIAPTMYWAVNVLIQSAYPHYVQATSLVLIFTATLPFTTIIRGRLVAASTASGNETFLLRYSLSGLVIVFLSVAFSYYLGGTPYTLAIGWALAIGIVGFGGGIVSAYKLPQPGTISDRYLAINALSASLLLLLVNRLDKDAMAIIVYILSALFAIWLSWRYVQHYTTTQARTSI